MWTPILFEKFGWKSPLGPIRPGGPAFWRASHHGSLSHDPCPNSRRRTRRNLSRRRRCDVARRKPRVSCPPKRGQVTCGSVMVPCPWFREFAEAAAGDPVLDLGVHLTLTSECANYRWAPISTVSRASGLIDDEGLFMARRREPARAFGARSRGNRVVCPNRTGAIGRDKPHPHRRPYGGGDVAGIVGIACPARSRLRAGLPVIDNIRGTLPVDAGAVEPGYRKLIEELPAGVTHFALHCTAPGDIEAISPQHAPWRTNEYALFAAGAVADWCRALAVVPIGYRQIQPLWTKAR
jgi:hypothetical protein